MLAPVSASPSSLRCSLDYSTMGDLGELPFSNLTSTLLEI